MSQPVLSVVDYAAWKRGYMPPSEHILIDELSYRGAKVKFSTQIDSVGIWIVVKHAADKPLPPKVMKAFRDSFMLMANATDEYLESIAAEPAPPTVEEPAP